MAENTTSTVQHTRYHSLTLGHQNGVSKGHLVNRGVFFLGTLLYGCTFFLYGSTAELEQQIVDFIL